MKKKRITENKKREKNVYTSSPVNYRIHSLLFLFVCLFVCVFVVVVWLVGWLVADF